MLELKKQANQLTKFWGSTDLWGMGGGRNHWYFTGFAAECSWACQENSPEESHEHQLAILSIFLNLPSWEHRFLSLSKKLSSLFEIFILKVSVVEASWGEIWKDHAVQQDLFQFANEGLVQGGEGLRGAGGFRRGREWFPGKASETFGICPFQTWGSSLL